MFPFLTLFPKDRFIEHFMNFVCGKVSCLIDTLHFLGRTNFRDTLFKVCGRPVCFSFPTVVEFVSLVCLIVN